MARWITIRQAFDFTWPSRAITAFQPGDLLVKDEVADFAVARGYADEGKVDGSARSTKGGKKRRAPRKAKAPAAKAPDERRADGVDSAPHADDGGAGNSSAVDPDAR